MTSSSGVWSRVTTDSPPKQTPSIRRRYSDPDLDSKIQFTLEHAFGDSDFSSAGTFSARLKTWSHGGQTLTKLRFSRNEFSNAFKNLLKGDDFYRIRLPSNVVSPPGREYVIPSVRADGANILAVSYGSPGACPYPRQLKFNSDIITVDVPDTTWTHSDEYKRVTWRKNKLRGLKGKHQQRFSAVPHPGEDDDSFLNFL
ncbi:ER membrane protein complex subunit 10 protein [Raphanus sativus]|nr:ER membrane protein complex subunit 10 protein [Raphanus sativus]KAJ4871955.1 ER membrane protein complex subunit 10 protein [Raphanus sativus]KAJ4873585.1 ER membrane protein complex subunit 10 protein [Raphanus sativus]KAJ4873865.1 ER membrane protein complex subunit 10 protein [Raphanus sativus]